MHLIFHIKTTSPPIRERELDRIHSYIGQLVNATGCKVIQVGGICDHIHILFLLSKDVAISHVVEEVKRNSSRWMKTIEPYYRTFAWQNGYGVFSVSQSVVEKTMEYVKNQGIHHKKMSFQDEYQKFLESYGVEYSKIIPRVSLRLPWAMRSLGFQPVCMSERMVRKHIATLEPAALLSRMGSNLNGTWIVDTHS